MSSALSKRLDRLEALLASRIAPPTWGWIQPSDDAAAALAGISEADRGRTSLWRWMTEAEAVAAGMEMPPPPPSPQSRAPAQLPAPPELKLLPAPSGVPGNADAAEQGAYVPLVEDPDFERVRVIPERQGMVEVDFHGPILYPRTGGI